MAAGIRDVKFVANMVMAFRLQRWLNVKQFPLQPRPDKPRLQQHLYRANARQRKYYLLAIRSGLPSGSPQAVPSELSRPRSKRPATWGAAMLVPL